MLPDSEKKIESSTIVVCNKPLTEHKNEYLEEQRKNTCSLVELSPNGNGTEISGTEAVSAEVEYIESEDMDDVEGVNTSLEDLIGSLESKDWVVLCGALNNLRRLSLFHKELLCDMLGDVISLVVKCLKNPRSAVCKTAVMTSADIFKAYTDDTIESLDPMLVQLLLKSSQDKRFVCEAAEKTLIAMTTWVSPVLLLPKLQPYLKNRNPRIRAKASMCFCRSVLRLGCDGIVTYGIDKLVDIAASQLSDKLPESREAARTLLLELQSVYEKSHNSSAASISDDQDKDSWEQFCQSNLSPLSAQAVLRVTNVAREGLAKEGLSTGP